jgi:glutaredoxin-like protein NrdH
MVSVTVYSTGPSCIRCTMTCRCLQSAGIPFHVVDVTTEPTALQFVTEELGYSEAPVVIVDEEPQHHWSGFRPDLIDRLADRLGTSPPAQIAPRAGLGLG